MINKKPAIFLDRDGVINILELAAKHNITLSRSILIGDRASDIEAGESAGCRCFLYLGDSLLEVIKKAIQYIEEINR